LLYLMIFTQERASVEDIKHNKHKLL